MAFFSLAELAAQLDCKVYGEAGLMVSGVSTLDKAGPQEITFLANIKYAPKARQTRAAAVIASEPLLETSTATLVSSNPYFDFARALALFYKPLPPAPGVHASAIIAPDAVIGPGASIGAYVVVGGGTAIGARAVLHPHAVIYGGCRIGDDFTAHSHVSVREFSLIGHRVTLHNGVTIGGDGFGFAKDNHGRQYKIVQTGRTVIEDDVEVQTLTSIDRATLGETRVKRGAKIDSLCQIGHGCVIGEDNIICGQTGLAGSTTLEENVIMAGQTGSAGHLTIHKNATVWAQSGLNRDVPADSTVSGYPAFEANAWLRASAVYPKLPEMLKTLRILERRIAELERGKLDEKRTDV
ncbi:MAG TPA: UDP-3-O-(3-hydroxymyristoyl)glucosamine N-acyltransferase [Bryobacteraceae bacterium]|jgi:UDP-3-O-[3-hydroxymyristoyl] glucosamine N-acyltransferase|nr:UDP-3-O-(3-hydroxymyristoyl)glucosamine N-acyltransferase [Bryobacteraceae bacterium]